MLCNNRDLGYVLEFLCIADGDEVYTVSVRRACEWREAGYEDP